MRIFEESNDAVNDPLSRDDWRLAVTRIPRDSHRLSLYRLSSRETIGQSIGIPHRLPALPGEAGYYIRSL